MKSKRSKRQRKPKLVEMYVSEFRNESVVCDVSVIEAAIFRNWKHVNGK